MEHLVERHRAGRTLVLVSHGAALRLAAEVLVDRVGTPGPEEDHVNNAGRVVLRRRTDDPGPWVLERGAATCPGGFRRRATPPGESAPAEVVQGGLVDAEVVGDLVHHGHGHLLAQLVLVLADVGEGGAVERDPVRQDAP